MRFTPSRCQHRFSGEEDVTSFENVLPGGGCAVSGSRGGRGSLSHLHKVHLPLLKPHALPQAALGAGDSSKCDSPGPGLTGLCSAQQHTRGTMLCPGSSRLPGDELLGPWVLLTPLACLASGLLPTPSCILWMYQVCAGPRPEGGEGLIAQHPAPGHPWAPSPAF